MLRKSALAVSLVLLVSFTPAYADAGELSDSEERALKAQQSLDHVLTADARQLAQQLGMRDKLERLRVLSEHSKLKAGAALSPEAVSLRMELVETIVTTMLQCQEVSTEIDSELSDARDAMAIMADRRDKAMKTNSMTNVYTNGLISTIGTVLQMPEQLCEQEGEILESGSTFMSAFLGMLALHQQNGEKLSSGIRPNMLARVFGLPGDSFCEYPEPIWRYLISPFPGAPQAQTRRQLLINAWEQMERVPARTSPKRTETLRMLAGTAEQKGSITMDVLDARAAMLDDLRSTIGQMYKDLLKLMLVIRAL